MFKKEIIERIAQKAKITKVAAEDFIDIFVETVKEGLKEDREVTLINFGSLKVVDTKAKTGRNPRTGEEVKIPAGKKVKFKAGKSLKSYIDNLKELCVKIP